MRSKFRTGGTRPQSPDGTAEPARRSKARKMAVYTPPATQAARNRYRLRPTWHKVIAVMLVIAGAGLFFSCEFNLGGIHQYGGHIWFLVGIAIAATSTWWFGLFDPA